jgi:hypothetical protein
VLSVVIFVVFELSQLGGLFVELIWLAEQPLVGEGIL